MEQHPPSNGDAEKGVAPVGVGEHPPEHPVNPVINNEKAPASAPGGEDANVQYPPGSQIALIMVSLMLAIFLVALDRTIIATAIPQITDDFNSIGDIGWYGSAYMLTSCGFQLIFGKIYTYYSTKWVFLTAILLFEIGSAIDGAAPNSLAFILGRAIAGVGSSGIFSGAILIMTQTIPLAKRPAYQGGFGSMFGLASIVGPLLGGAFTTKVSWRFYINLPIGAVTILVIAFILHVNPPRTSGKSLKEQFLQLDPIGTTLFLPGIVCLVLALQWGGSTYTWGNARVVVLLVLACLLLIGFIGVQFWKQESATVPPRIITQRSVASGFYYSFCLGSAMMVLVYFIPTWFQSIKDVSAYESGIRMLPMVLALVVGSVQAGFLTSMVGYYAPFMIAGSVFMSIGAGLITTFTPETGHAKWIGYQILFGYGLGLGMQIPSMAAQTVLSLEDVAVGASLMFFAQWLGGAIFISVAQNILSSQLVKDLAVIPGFDPKYIVNGVGATDLRNVIPAQILNSVLVIYNTVLTHIFEVALILSCISILGAATLEWKSVKGTGGW
ncbi:hypothetical protein B7494_g5816 [Chlorociboria aeruginascens]|nr:hypothetical protein B7494_g5816 [Chlorociboria aeruginascens]